MPALFSDYWAEQPPQLMPHVSLDHARHLVSSDRRIASIVQMADRQGEARSSEVMMAYSRSDYAARQYWGAFAIAQEEWGKGQEQYCRTYPYSKIPAASFSTPNHVPCQGATLEDGETKKGRL